MAPSVAAVLLQAGAGGNARRRRYGSEATGMLRGGAAAGSGGLGNGGVGGAGAGTGGGGAGGGGAGGATEGGCSLSPGERLAHRRYIPNRFRAQRRATTPARCMLRFRRCWATTPSMGLSAFSISADREWSSVLDGNDREWRTALRAVGKRWTNAVGPNRSRLEIASAPRRTRPWMPIRCSR